MNNRNPYRLVRLLDEIFGRIEAAGLAEDLDAQLNEAADVLTDLLARVNADRCVSYNF